MKAEPLFFGSDNPGVPSVEAAKVWRKQGNLPNFDFFNYAGINRPVRLYTTPVSRICGLTLIPDIDGTDGILRYEAETEGEGAVHVEIFDVEGNKAAEAEGASGTITIPDARLWWPWPGTPYLYRAVFTFGEDIYEETFGIRTVKVEGTQFLISRTLVVIFCHQEVNSPTDLTGAAGCMGYGNVIVFDKAEGSVGGTVLCY